MRWNPWLFRLPAWVFLTAALYKLTESVRWGLIGPSHGHHYRKSQQPFPDFDYYDENGDDYKSLLGMQEALEDFRSDPVIRSQRCDACRLVARRFDAAFKLAEENVLPYHEDRGGGSKAELDGTEVAEVVAEVCRRRRLEHVVPVVWKGRPRIAAKGLETWRRLQRMPSITTALSSTGSSSSSGVDWPQRVRNHCRFLAEKLEGDIVYDMWLRTSAGPGADPFESFLCYGEGVFGDCNEWISPGEPWPAGDGDEEDGEEEEEEEDQDDVDGRGMRAAKYGIEKRRRKEEEEEGPGFLLGLEERVEAAAEEAAERARRMGL